MKAQHCSERMAGLETKRARTTCDDDATGDGHGLGSLTGMGAVQHAFHFLDGPADVLRASTASRRWRELATADVVWRPKAVREGMVEKAGVFEVALPAAADGAAAADEEEDKELAGVGLAFYSQVFVLKVGLAWRGLRGRAFHSHHHRRSHPLPPIGRGTR